MNLRAIGIILAAAALVAAALFHLGVKSGRKAVLVEQSAEALKVSAVVVKADSARSDTAAKETVVAVKASIAAHAARRPVRASVKVVSDSQVSIDSGPSVLVPPAVINLLGLDDRVQAADSTTKAQLTTENAAQRVEINHLKERIVLLEERVELVEPGRCGAKCGAVAGAAGTLALILALLAVL